MLRVEKTVFISYRRTSKFIALSIYQHLTSQGYDVFFDYNSIHSGDFEQNIFANIKARAHFIVLLSNEALERVTDSNDLFRREIELAIETQRNIIPLTVEGFDWAVQQRHLTGQLAMLAKYNALRLPIDYFDEAMTRLCNKHLNVPLDTVLHPANSTAQQVAVVQKNHANQAAKVPESNLTAEQYIDQAYDLAEQGQHDEAIAKLTEAIRLKPDYAGAFYNRGIAHQANGDLDNALADYNKAIRLKPDDASAFYNRGNTHQDYGNLDNALADYNKAIRLKPDHAKAFNNRGIVHKANGDYQLAINDYLKYLDLGGGTHYNNQQQVEKTIQDLQAKLAAG